MFKQVLFSLILATTIVHITHPMVLFSGNSNKELAQEIAQYLNISLSDAKAKRFNDGEISIQLKENVRQKVVYIVQPTCSTSTHNVNDIIMELILMIRAAKRASAKTINLVIPYYGYARQDRKTRPRVPISAADVALLLEAAGADRVITVDLHCGQIQGFFHDIPVDNLYGSTVFLPYITSKADLTNVVVVSPDAGGVERASQFIAGLKKHGVQAEMSVISKQRAGAGIIGSMHLIGSVENADAIIIDDMCDTGGTLIKAAELLKEHGARRVFAVITHPVFSNNALEKIGNSIIDEMIITNTIPLRGTAPANITCLSVAPLLGEAIKRIEEGGSISALFE